MGNSYQIPVLTTFEYQKAVIDRLSTPPNINTKGDRYLVGKNPSGAWHNKPKYIVEYVGEDNKWIFTKPIDGMVLFIKSENCWFQYVKNKWCDFNLLMNGRRRVTSHNIDHKITLDEVGMVFVDSLESKDLTFTLPSVSASDIGITFSFANITKNGKLIIQASDDDIIADSGPGCTIYNSQEQIAYSSLTLILLESNHWGILTGNGIWRTTVEE